ncbi:MAG: hypothetical protein HYR67_19785 [Bacteroidetes bacterium]|nr:hypothetical protein [Bacteroidota bacterium]
MNRGFCLVILFLVLGHIGTVCAQENFVPGSVINSKGDTLKGLINDQRWHNSPSVLQFKNMGGVVSSYKPIDINGFQINGKSTFLSAEISYDSTSIQVDQLPSSSQPAFKKDYVFLRYVVQGITSLLTFEESDRMHLFIQKGNTIEELVYHRYRTPGGFIPENKAYVTQLQKYFGDCSSVPISIKLPYTTHSIRDLFIRYNECGNNKSKVFDKEDKTFFKVGIVSFVAYDQFSPNFKGGAGYGAGGFINMTFPNKNYMVSLYSELAYRKTGHQKRTDPSEHHYELQSIQWSNLVRFRLLPNYPRLLLGGGFSFSDGIAGKYYFINPAKVEATRTRMYASFIGDVCLKLGNHGMIDLRYENGDPITMKDFPPGNIGMYRTGSVRFSLAWQF